MPISNENKWLSLGDWIFSDYFLLLFYQFSLLSATVGITYEIEEQTVDKVSCLRNLPEKVYLRS